MLPFLSGKNVNLNWSTSSEINSNLFDVERSEVDQNNFTKIGEVKSVGNSVVLNDYSLLDVTPNLSSINYYRLKQVDMNNAATYFPTLSVDFTTTSSTSAVDNLMNTKPSVISIYPVPASDIINLSLKNNSYKGDVIVNVYNLIGKLVLTTNGTFSNTNTKISQNVGSLNPGIYMLEVVSKDGLFKDQIKFMKE